MIELATSLTELAKKIQLTREELARLNGSQASEVEDEQPALNILCRMSFSAVGDAAQRALILKEFKAVAEES